MVKHRYTAEEIIHKLREADVLIGHAKAIGNACKAVEDIRARRNGEGK